MTLLPDRKRLPGDLLAGNTSAPPAAPGDPPGVGDGNCARIEVHHLSALDVSPGVSRNISVFDEEGTEAPICVSDTACTDGDSKKKDAQVGSSRSRAPATLRSLSLAHTLGLTGQAQVCEGGPL